MKFFLCLTLAGCFSIDPGPVEVHIKCIAVELGSGNVVECPDTSDEVVIVEPSDATIAAPPDAPSDAPADVPVDVSADAPTDVSEDPGCSWGCQFEDQ